MWLRIFDDGVIEEEEEDNESDSSDGMVFKVTVVDVVGVGLTCCNT